MLRLLTLMFMLVTTQASASQWSVRSDESKLGFFATQMGAEFEGAFKAFNPSITFDADDLAASAVKIVIQIKSVDTQSGDRDSNILNKDWFDEAKHPQAIFETQAITDDGKGGYLARANLTMRGVTKQVELPFSLNIYNGIAHAKGEVNVSRTDFGIGQGEWAADTVVGDGVRIFFDLKADAQ